MGVKSTFALALLAAALLLSGCASRPVVSIRTVADLDHAFAPVAGAPVRVAVWRHVGESEGEGEASAAGRIVSAAQLTLEERNFIAGVQAGFRRAGFEIITAGGADENRAAYLILASMDTATGMHDTFRRVPVIESTTAHVHGRGGFRTYTATTTSDYIVPERRPFVHRIVTLTAIPGSETTGTPAMLSPDSPAAVWRGRVISDADVIDEALPLHIATMLETWSVTATREVKYERNE